MTSWIQGFARRLWRGDAGVVGRVVSVLLLPLEWAWWFVVTRRNQHFERTARVPIGGLQVISVGNLAVGGTGKTPIASWIVRELAAGGRNPALLHGGYGMDEPALHSRWTPDVPVLVERDRVAAAHEALLQGAGVVVLDDGFQHRRLVRDVDLVVLAVEDRFPGPLLPRGPYREPVRSLERADAIVLTRRTATKREARSLAEDVRRLVPDVPVIACAHLEPGALRPLGEPSAEPVDAGALGAVLVLTAVGRPDAVRRGIADMVGSEVTLRAHADHHLFSESDVLEARRRAGRRAIVVTEKDAVKLEPFSEELGVCYVMEQSLRWDWGEDVVRSLIGVEGTAT
ncbi:MAG: tetraacyldisaccharide 4'-kinase [Longimicrobiales bacterium]|jgi:tetraacyldisaccharide 4'-kinase